jgi:ribosomal protein L32
MQLPQQQYGLTHLTNCKNCGDPEYEHVLTTDGDIVCCPMRFKDGILLGAFCKKDCRKFEP